MLFTKWHASDVRKSIYRDINIIIKATAHHMAITSRWSYNLLKTAEGVQEEEMRGAETVFEGIAETRDISLVNYPGRIVCLLIYCRSR